MFGTPRPGTAPSQPRQGGAHVGFRAGVAAATLMTLSGAAMAQQQRPVTDFTVERRDALRRVWHSDSAIRDHVEPGEGERVDAGSDFYSVDYNGRGSLSPESALAMQPRRLDVAVALVTR